MSQEKHNIKVWIGRELKSLTVLVDILPAAEGCAEDYIDDYTIIEVGGRPVKIPWSPLTGGRVGAYEDGLIIRAIQIARGKNEPKS